MAFDIVDNIGKAPRMHDSTRNWVERSRKDGLIKPSFILRVATDTNYMRTDKMMLYKKPHQAYTNSLAMMNVALPGMKIPGILNWSVTETLEQVAQQATFEALNCLPISQIQTTLSTPLAQQHHTNTISASYVADSLFVVEKVANNKNVEYQKDKQGYGFREFNVKYREFQHDSFTVADASQFPDPAIPNDEDNDIPDDTNYPSSNTGSGSYFIQIDDEVIRVISKNGNTFQIPPGGRAVSGSLQAHSVGAPVKLLGFPPYTKQWTALGYLNVDEDKPYKAILRPGACFTSYEGYGDIQGETYNDYEGAFQWSGTLAQRPAASSPFYITGSGGVAPPSNVVYYATDTLQYFVSNGRQWLDISNPKFGLRHNYKKWRNYAFTGYWFITDVEPSLQEDGIPRVQVTLKNAGHLVDDQKISPDLVRRVKNQFGQWRIGEKNQTIWGAARYNRDIPGDWVDYNHWDNSLVGSYPLMLRTEFAQHKAFYDHMQETEFGTKCEICRQEHAEWRKTHKPGGPLAFVEQRAVGKHIYKESIRVIHEEAGPIKTYIRLMATMAAAAWDHPAMGTELAQKFTKIPNALFDNIRNINTGLVYNGQVILDTQTHDKAYDWFTPTYDDTKVVSKRGKLTCPFESDYDNVPFSQPMQDLADINGCTFWVDRQGYPVFKPKMFSMRPRNTNSEWFLSYGASIDAYQPTLTTADIITQCWVTANTAFDTNMTVLCGGTGIKGKSRVMYSALGGSRDGLMLTSGVQQVETEQLDNITLGLDWDTKPHTGVKMINKRGKVFVTGEPELYNGSPALDEHHDGKAFEQSVRRIQNTVNFFLIRKYMHPFQDNKGNWILKLSVDGKYGPDTTAGVKELQRFLGQTINGTYDRHLYDGARAWIDGHQHLIRYDVFWYVANHKDWSEYIAAVTGVPIPVTIKKIKADKGAPPMPDYVPNEKKLNSERSDWTKTFARAVVNVGNRKVDESIAQASTRTLSTNLADPRIQCGDVIWAEVPGFTGIKQKVSGSARPPFNNGIYVTQVTRQLDLTTGSYTGSYVGTRFRGDFNQGLKHKAVHAGYDFV